MYTDVNVLLQIDVFPNRLLISPCTGLLTENFLNTMTKVPVPPGKMKTAHSLSP